MSRSVTIKAVVVFEWDVVRVTGQASSPVHRFEGLIGTVGAACDDEHGKCIKVWPQKGQPDPDSTGKIWFHADDVESIEVIETREEYRCPRPSTN